MRCSTRHYELRQRSISSQEAGSRLGVTYHMPKRDCRRPIMTAMPGEEKPVSFWNSVKTKLADCLLSLVARMVITTTKNESMFQTRTAVEILLSKDAAKILTRAAMMAMR